MIFQETFIEIVGRLNWRALHTILSIGDGFRRRAPQRSAVLFDEFSLHGVYADYEEEHLLDSGFSLAPLHFVRTSQTAR
jgi:hypothetical protein